MSSLMQFLRSLRHLKGYGIHSPYAYMLATEVLRLPGGYSYYDEGLLKPVAMPRLAVALQRFEWRFGTMPRIMEENEQPGADAPAVWLNPSKPFLDQFRKETPTGVLFFGKRAMVYFPNSKVRFVAYEYRF